MYAETSLGLTTRYRRPEGKLLVIGGGFVNFTDVAAGHEEVSPAG